jgi:putative endonuclease
MICLWHPAVKPAHKGAGGATIGCRFLEGQGYTVRETNYRCPEGEIDIVAQKGDCLVFAEVRTRRSLGFGTPEESVTAAKKEKLTNTALYYVAAHSDLPAQWRVDVVAVEVGSDGEVRRLEHIEDALS